MRAASRFTRQSFALLLAPKVRNLQDFQSDSLGDFSGGRFRAIWSQASLVRGHGSLCGSG